MIEVMFELMRYFGLNHRPSSSKELPSYLHGSDMNLVNVNNEMNFENKVAK